MANGKAAHDAGLGRRACAISSDAAASARGRRGLPRLPALEHATQTVFGEGRARAGVMLVGEQPGDREDLEGTAVRRPGRAAARRRARRRRHRPRRAYVTNAVKHFKWQARGKRRIHEKPTLERGRRLPAVAARPSWRW